MKWDKRNGVCTVAYQSTAMSGCDMLHCTCELPHEWEKSMPWWMDGESDDGLSSASLCNLEDTPIHKSENDQEHSLLPTETACKGESPCDFECSSDIDEEEEFKCTDEDMDEIDRPVFKLMPMQFNEPPPKSTLSRVLAIRFPLKTPLSFTFAKRGDSRPATSPVCSETETTTQSPASPMSSETTGSSVFESNPSHERPLQFTVKCVPSDAVFKPRKPLSFSFRTRTWVELYLLRARERR
jgi:hypothetical protein